jgi:hypothetical protein
MRMLFANLRCAWDGASDANVCTLALKRFSQVYFPNALTHNCHSAMPTVVIKSLENKCITELLRGYHTLRSAFTKCRCRHGGSSCCALLCVCMLSTIAHNATGHVKSEMFAGELLGSSVAGARSSLAPSVHRCPDQLTKQVSKSIHCSV